MHSSSPSSSQERWGKARPGNAMPNSFNFSTSTELNLNLKKYEIYKSRVRSMHLHDPISRLRFGNHGTEQI